MVVIDHATVERLVSAYALKKAEAVGDEFVRRAKARSSRRTGRLAESIQADDLHLTGDAAVVRVSVGVDYGAYQDEGTGIYGPTGERITPSGASGVLVFDWPAAGGSQPKFFRSVAGSPGTHFWSATVDEWAEILRAAS